MEHQQFRRVSWLEYSICLVGNYTIHPVRRVLCVLMFTYCIYSYERVWRSGRGALRHARGREIDSTLRVIVKARYAFDHLKRN